MNYVVNRPKIKINKKKEKRRELNPLDKKNFFLSKTTHSQLKILSRQIGLPVSLLISIAVDNELDTPMPFTYKIDLPTTEYKEFMYAKQAGRIIHFLQERMPDGTSRNMLLLCRRDMGIEDKEEFLSALRELYEKEIVEEFIPTNTKFPFYKSDFRYVRIKDLNRKNKPQTSNTEDSEE